MNKTIELDDGLTEEALSSVPYSQDIQYDKTHAAFDENNQTVSDAISQDSTADSKVAGDAKTPLPKPKKPPNLPS